MWRNTAARACWLAACRLAGQRYACQTPPAAWRPVLRACSAVALTAGGGFAAVQCDGNSPTGTFRYSFCGKPETFTPIFGSTPAANTASVNAGDYKLYVGGGAINKGFAVVLKLEEPNEYVDLHTAMLEVALQSPGQLVSDADAQENVRDMRRRLGLVGCFARVPADSLPVVRGGPVGVTFVDVLAPEKRPLSEKNVAMLYVVGPKGDGAPGPKQPTIKDREEFLTTVRSMAANLILAVSGYNAQIGKEAAPDVLPPIDIMQMCLVSGGVFRHPATSKLDVASAIVQGLATGAGSCVGASQSTLPEVRFAYDDHNFEDAVSTILSSKL